MYVHVCVCAGVIPSGRPLCSLMQAPVEPGWMCRWLSDTACRGHSVASYLHPHTTKGKTRHPTNKHERHNHRRHNVICMKKKKGFHNYVVILHLQFMKLNEFRDHSRFGFSLRSPAVCRCTGSCRWVHSPVLFCHPCGTVKIFISFTSECLEEAQT